MTPSTTRNRLFSVLAETEKNIEAFVNSPGADMTRHRLCPFSDTILSTLLMTGNRTNTEILNYFYTKRKSTPSKSAFTQQRKKFNQKLFPHLLNEFNRSTPFKKTLKGYHLIAVDGSDVNLPTDRNDTVYRIKQARSDRHYYQMHINALFDICENRYLDINIQPRPILDEKTALCELIETDILPPNSIILADRGYCSLNILARLTEKRSRFLIRAKSPTADTSLLQGIMTPDEIQDGFLTVAATRSRKQRVEGADIVKKIRKDRKFDLIDSSDDRSVYMMTLRFTCISLSNGEYEYLISNIPENEFSAQELKELYWMRWGIETSFRRLKYILSLSNLHSVSRELIIQEVYAKIILYNFASLIHAYGQECRELMSRKTSNRYIYKVSFDDSVPIARHLIMKSIKNGKIKTLLLRHLTATKEFISSTRRVRSQTVHPLNNRA